MNYYPSITLELLQKALDWASQFTDISEEEIKIILETKRSLLILNGEFLTKKGEENFDLAQGSFDSAEGSDLVGLFMLSELEKRNLAEKLGLFRDDGFGASKGSCQEIDDINKIICEVFRSHGLEITVDANKKRVKFLDVEFDLENNTFKPYIKENDVRLYVHKNINHPPSITKNIPDSVNRRLSALSSDEQSFLSVSDKYQQALTNSANTYKLAYKPPNQTQKRHRSRKKGRLYFNPPYSLSVKINVGKIFLQLIDKHFPKTNSLSKIVNRQKVKLSYRTTPNMKKIISSHNAKILRKSEITPPEKTCNCRQKDSCPVEGKCLTDNIIYQANHSHINTHYPPFPHPDSNPY